MSSSYSDDRDAVYAPVLKLSSLMKTVGVDKVDVLKMDVEGFEYDVLQNMLEAVLKLHNMLAGRSPV
jgi:FkbM family methyltransferase